VWGSAAGQTHEWTLFPRMQCTTACVAVLPVLMDPKPGCTLKFEHRFGRMFSRNEASATQISTPVEKWGLALDIGMLGEGRRR
jgi:hypothetical protein